MFGLFADILGNPLVFVVLVVIGFAFLFFLLLAAAYFVACAIMLVFCIPYPFWRARPAAQEVPVIELPGMRGAFHEMANAARLYLHWMTGRPHSIKSFAIR